MLPNLILGTLIISATVLIHTLGLMALSRSMARIVRWFRLHRHDFGRTVAITTTVLGIFAIHTLEIWLWAAAYTVTGAIGSFDVALTFSTEMFSTVGSGMHLLANWRQLAALESVDGFILIGWSIAYLVAASTRHGPFRSGEHF